MSLRKIIALAVAIIGLILFFIFKQGLASPAPNLVNNSGSQVNNQEPQVVSTNPDLKTAPVILFNQVIEITFNKPLENAGQFKYQLEPADKVSLKVELSDDKKTVKLVPQTPYPLDEVFRLKIDGMTRFEGGVLFNKAENYEFKTLEYNGV